MPFLFIKKKITAAINKIANASPISSITLMIFQLAAPFNASLTTGTEFGDNAAVPGLLGCCVPTAGWFALFAGAGEGVVAFGAGVGVAGAGVASVKTAEDPIWAGTLSPALIIAEPGANETEAFPELITLNVIVPKFNSSLVPPVIPAP